ncbi:MAG: channel protein hemolysin family [Thermoleophilia bacterium]|nr:channel protein hemolysin family [Thermoleophilia bacterium]
MSRQDVREELTNFRDDAALLMEVYLTRPLLRGVSHLVGFFTAIGASLVMVLQAGAAIQVVASIVYGAGLALALGTSALYHRIKWRPRAYTRIRKLDHSMIYVLIASSCTPFALLAADGWWRWASLAGIWVLAATGIIARWTMKTQPRWFMVTTYIAMGWATVALMPDIKRASESALVLTCIGGGLYTIGAMVYLFKRPNPLPRVFGFHEVFHAFVCAAATCHFLAVWPLITSPTNA